MGLLNRGNTSAVTLRKPLPVNDITFASTVFSQTDTLSASAGAAGTKGTLMLSFAPVASAQGDLVGNFIDKSLAITSTALTTEVPFEVVAARAAANQNLSMVGEGAPDYKAYLENGEFYVIYETGRLFYSKADASTAVSATYKYRGGATSSPAASTSTAWAKDVSAALEASSIAKASAGVLRLVSGRINSTAASGTYYVLLMDSATLPADGAVTLLAAPTKIVHVTGTDSPFILDFTEGGIAASSGIVVCLSSTEFTKTIGGAYLSMTILYK